MAIDRQFRLEEPQTGSVLTCWLKDDPRLKVGVRVTLKETGKRLWRIAWRSEHTVEDANINRHWRVGGLI
jgi:hypothetical protein